MTQGRPPTRRAPFAFQAAVVDEAACRNPSLPANRAVMHATSSHRSLSLGRIIGWIVKAILWFVVLSVLWVALYRFVPPPVTVTMLTNALDGRGITEDWMPISRIDPNMARAAIGAEDSRFCLHHGFDFTAIQKAMEHNEDSKRIRGGSTISQQTAKNVFLWQGRSYVRKGLEAWFTVLIETIWGKRRIME